jgi:hypothetical protein
MPVPEDLVQGCLDALRGHLPRPEHLAVESYRDSNGEVTCTLELDGSRLEFLAIVQPRVDQPTAPLAIQAARRVEQAGRRPLLFTRRVSEEVGREFRANAMAYVDLGGNAWIHGPGLRLLVTGRPPAPTQTVDARLRGTTLRLLGEFLVDPASGTRTQTELSVRAGIALGAVGAARDQLTQVGLLDRTGPRHWRVRDRSTALDEFARGWATLVRPRLGARRYRLLAPSDASDLSDRIERHAVDLQLLVGGELAAGWLTSFLETEYATLHVPSDRHKEVARVLGLAPDGSGPIALVDQYGAIHSGPSGEVGRAQIVHPLWIWAECATSGDERVAQVAQLVRAHHLDGTDG